MNVELLLKVKQHILDNPEQFDIDLFERDTACGTTRCIGGWAHVLGGASRPIQGPFYHPITKTFVYPGQYELRLTDEQADKLFFITSWPKAFFYRDGLGGSRVTASELAAARIDHFIATNGEE